jgi:hypothetical protein
MHPDQLRQHLRAILSHVEELERAVEDGELPHGGLAEIDLIRGCAYDLARTYGIKRVELHPEI